MKPRAHHDPEADPFDAIAVALARILARQHYAAESPARGTKGNDQ